MSVGSVWEETGCRGCDHLCLWTSGLYFMCSAIRCIISVVVSNTVRDSL